LRQPLGQWTTLQKHTRQIWNWYYHHSTGNLIQRHHTGFGVHPATNHMRQLQSQLRENIQCLPHDAIPVTTREYRIASIPETQASSIDGVKQDEAPNTFAEYVDQLLGKEIAPDNRKCDRHA
jgi:hypothetical protein